MGTLTDTVSLLDYVLTLIRTARRSSLICFLSGYLLSLKWLVMPGQPCMILVSVVCSSAFLLDDLILRLPSICNWDWVFVPSVPSWRLQCKSEGASIDRTGFILCAGFLLPSFF